MGHCWSALADQPEEGDLCNDNECGAFLDEHRRSRRDRHGFEERAGDARESNSVQLVSNAFGLEVEVFVARALRLEGLGVRVGVLSKSPDQLVEVPQVALGVLVVRSSHMPRLIEGTAAATEHEDHTHSKPLGPVVSFPTSNDTAEGGG